MGPCIVRIFYYPTRCNVTQFILYGNCSTYFWWYPHLPSGAQTNVSTASGICQTVTVWQVQQVVTEFCETNWCWIFSTSWYWILCNKLVLNFFATIWYWLLCSKLVLNCVQQVGIEFYETNRHWILYNQSVLNFVNIIYLHGKWITLNSVNLHSG
jgi:hypothetical protein